MAKVARLVRHSKAETIEKNEYERKRNEKKVDIKKLWEKTCFDIPTLKNRALRARLKVEYQVCLE